MKSRSEDDPRDFFDVFLNESEKQKAQDPNTSFHRKIRSIDEPLLKK